MIQTEAKTMVVGIDISVEETTCAVVDIRGNIICIQKFASEDYPNVNQYVTKLCEVITQVIDASCGIEKVKAVGISVASGNLTTGCIENAPNLPWKGVIPLAAMLRDRLGLAVALGNDCHAAVLGEHAFGSGHGMKNVCTLSIGYGLGCGMIIDGRLYQGNRGFAGELGHTCVVENGRHCNCGRDGCLERYVSGGGIVMTAKELMDESDKPSLMRGYTPLTAKYIVECCEKGDELAIEVYNRTGHILGKALSVFASIMDPEAIIFTGGISKAGKWLLEPTIRSFDEHVFPNIRGHVSLIMSTIDLRERDILGASVLAWSAKEYSLFK